MNITRIIAQISTVLLFGVRSDCSSYNFRKWRTYLTHGLLVGYLNNIHKG